MDLRGVGRPPNVFDAALSLAWHNNA
jgi:hypothetical protein